MIHQKPKSDLPPLEGYQQEAIDFINSNWHKKLNSLCALDVGMGKTRVACEILSNLFADTAFMRLQGYALVCCPTSGIIDTIWTETLNKYNLKKFILKGEQIKRIKMEGRKELTIPPQTVCLITYANLIKEYNLEYIINTPPNFIIFDEYHTLTNNSKKKDQKYRDAIKKLPLRVRLGLTATPFVNNEMESVLAYGFLNDMGLFDIFQTADEDYREALIQEVRTKQILFIKEQPYNLTPASDWVVSIPMGKEHYNQYLAVKKEIRSNQSNHMKNVHQIGKLSVSTSLVDSELKKELSCNIETGKIKAIRAIISHLPAGDKIVICDNYRETLEYIMRLDFMRALKPLLYVGGTKNKNDNNIESFNNNPECRSLLTTRQEGGEGVNLQAANHLILINCWYTVKDIIQILGRIKRKGQKKPVYTYILGYNLFDCIEPKSEMGLCVLEEDEDFYKRIRLKKEMCEEWGIKVESKLPPIYPFFNYSTFENEFNTFLENQIIKAPLKITDKELNEEINKSKEEYLDREAKKQAFYEREMEMGESYLEYAYLQYMSYMQNKSSTQKSPKVKVTVKKRKPV